MLLFSALLVAILSPAKAVAGDIPTAAIAANAEKLSFSGVVGYNSPGGVNLQAFGKANEEWQVPMTTNSKFGIGSNSKLFATIALYQLQEQNLVNISHPVAAYLDENDFKAFGMPSDTKTYCPKLRNFSKCENLTIGHLLSMSSGIPVIKDFFSEKWLQYEGSVAAYVGRFIKAPLEFTPGSKFEYSNQNFLLATYLVEKISQMSFQEYLEENIFKPAGLHETSFDEFDGSIKFRESKVDSYNIFYQNSVIKSIGTCRPYFSLAAISGTGGLVSTVDDMIKLYNELFSYQTALLTKESIKTILKPWNKLPESFGGASLGGDTFYFGHGIIVEYSNMASSSRGPDSIRYCGGLKCTKTCITRTREGRIAAAFTNHYHVNVTDMSLLKKQPFQKTLESLMINDLASYSSPGVSEMISFLLK